MKSHLGGVRGGGGLVAVHQGHGDGLGAGDPALGDLDDLGQHVSHRPISQRDPGQAVEQMIHAGILSAGTPLLGAPAPRRSP